MIDDYKDFEDLKGELKPDAIKSLIAIFNWLHEDLKGELKQCIAIAWRPTCYTVEDLKGELKRRSRIRLGGL